MPAERERVSAAHHEQRAIKHVVQIENPGRWRIQDVALEYLYGNHEGRGDDQPRESFARPVTDLIDGMDQALCVHRTQNQPAIYHDGRWLAEWLGSVAKRLALLGLRLSGRCRGLRGRLTEVVVIGHAWANLRVEIPLHRARSELALRGLDLFK